ncbi:MAG: helix-turn-helix transcriptional regulator [Stenotrophobium sp.]
MQNLRIRPAKLPDDSHTAVVDLQSALDLDSIWKSCLKLVRNQLPHRSCSLMFNIVGLEPTSAKHHVESSRNPGYVPATSLTISGPYLERHPRVQLYTYSEILSEDPDAMRRRIEQEPDPEWTEFVHLAFWRDERPEAVLSIHRPPDHSDLNSEERAFLEYLHPMIEASLRRVRATEQDCARRLAYESLLYRMPVATLLVADDGHQLFATAEGKKLCERWNRGLREAAERKLQLPQSLVQLFGSSAQASGGKILKLHHPRIKGLTATVERSLHTAALRERPSYVVTLADEHSAAVDAASTQPSPEAWAALQKLSPTERRVALLVAKGLRNDEIAEHLCRSRRTIEFQLNSIYRKLSLSRRTQLVLALS